MKSPCRWLMNPLAYDNTRIAAAKGRVKPPARLLRYATALRVTAPLGCGSRRPGMAESSLSARPPPLQICMIISFIMR